VSACTGVVMTVLDISGAAQAGFSVYMYDSATYTSCSKSTNSAGQAVFTFPMGNYHFRADLNSTQFWSGTTNHCSVPGCTSVTLTTTVPVTVTVLDAYNAPQANVAVYVFDGATYTNYSKSTNSSGQAVFTLPMGSYRFRADKNGTKTLAQGGHTYVRTYSGPAD
jgi:hypothetical protein